MSAFADCVATSNVKTIGAAIQRIDALFEWPAALRAALRLPAPSQRFRRHFLNQWLPNGDHLRLALQNDLLLADFLRHVLPAYSGRGLTLWRGDSFHNRRRRTYGLSWTQTEEVGRSFAQGLWQVSEDGFVLLKTEAPAQAVICSPMIVNDGYGEQEYLVDRRRLSRVDVVERFPQREPEGNGAQS